ncbi:molybdopterin molybdenumtransferase MoeA, partial [Rhizobium ruizarguesonis]
MARLGDRRASSGLVTLEQAAADAVARVQPIEGTVVLPLASADGHVLARAVIAPHDLPPFANSAVDGYAFNFADLT